MDEPFREKMQQRLTKIRAEILENIQHESADFADATSNDSVKDSVDLASNDVDIRLLETLGSQDVKRLKKVEAAIGRIRNGRFGLCAKCHKKVDQERLEAIPYAAFCINCQKGREGS